MDHTPSPSRGCSRGRARALNLTFTRTSGPHRDAPRRHRGALRLVSAPRTPRRRVRPGTQSLHRSVLRYNRATAQPLGRLPDALSEYGEVIDADPNPRVYSSGVDPAQVAGSTGDGRLPVGVRPPALSRAPLQPADLAAEVATSSSARPPRHVLSWSGLRRCLARPADLPPGRDPARLPPRGGRPEGGAGAPQLLCGGIWQRRPSGRRGGGLRRRPSGRRLAGGGWAKRAVLAFEAATRRRRSRLTAALATGPRDLRTTRPWPTKPSVAWSRRRRLRARTCSRHQRRRGAASATARPVLSPDRSSGGGNDGAAVVRRLARTSLRRRPRVGPRRRGLRSVSCGRTPMPRPRRREPQRRRFGGAEGIRVLSPRRASRR